MAVSPAERRDFRFLLAAIGVSALGSRITRTALPMAAILLLGATPLQLGWLSVLGVLPGALVAWWAGAWIDRRSRRAVLIGADWARALLIASIPAAALLDSLTLIQLGIVAALVCMATVLFEIADHAYLPVIVQSGHLVEANGKRETVDALAEIAGPPLGGALVQWLTAPFALAIDACSFVASALLIGRIRASERARDWVEPAQSAAGTSPPHEKRDPLRVRGGQVPLSAGASLLREAREGAALVWRHPLLRPLFLSTTLLTFFMSFMSSLYTLYALQTLHMSPGVLGLVIGCGGIGALAGAAAAPALVRRIGPGRTALAGLLLGGFAQLFVPLAPADPFAGAAFLIASQLLGDGLLVIYLVTETSLRQQAVAPETLGRAAAVWKMAGSIVAPIGMMLGALLAEYAGIRSALWVLVGGAIVAGLPLVAARHALALPPKPR